MCAASGSSLDQVFTLKRVPAHSRTSRFTPSPLGGTTPPCLELWRTEQGLGGDGMAKCGARTLTGGRCQRQVVSGTSRCPVHQGPWSAYGVAQRKEKEAQAKKRKKR